MKGKPDTGDSEKPPQTQNEIHQMGDKKAHKIPFHPPAGQQQIKKRHIHGGGEDVVAHADFLLAQALGHGIHDGVAVEHGGKHRVQPQIPPGLGTAIEPPAQRLCRKIQHSAEGQGVEGRYF